MPVFRFDKVLGIARGVRAFLGPEGGIARGAAAGARRRAAEHKKMLKSERRTAKQELSQARKDLHTAKGKGEKDGAQRFEQMKRARKKRQELLQLKSELQAAKERGPEGVLDGSMAPRVAGESEMGALPDFVIIGPGRSGTTFLYRLLSQHPLVEPAAKKELHFYDLLFEEGAEWYRRWFPAPRLKDGRKTITGEATPAYIFHPDVPERMAKVIPRARLIALLRNPVDKIYSAYQRQVSKGRESRTFEEVIEADLDDGSVGLLLTGIYVDHLVRWSEFLSEEQLLVLKSEDLFEYPRRTLKVVLEFLGLPDWEPEAWQSGKNHRYEEMDPATRKRLEEYFEPHNRRLYDYLGVDFGW